MVVLSEMHGVIILILIDMNFRTNFTENAYSREVGLYAPEFDEAVPDDSMSIKDIVAFYTSHGELPQSNANAFYAQNVDDAPDFDSEETITSGEISRMDFFDYNERMNLAILEQSVGDVEKIKNGRSQVDATVSPVQFGGATSPDGGAQPSGPTGPVSQVSE